MATQPGLAPMNIRQPAPDEPGAIDTSPIQIDFADEGGDNPETDENGNIISIEHDCLRGPASSQSTAKPGTLFMNSRNIADLHNCVKNMWYAFHSGISATLRVRLPL